MKNNSAKFEGDDFMFQLTDEELDGLSRCKNFTLNRGNGRGKNVKYNPYVFTEQGIYMLMTVLRGDLATKQSRALVRTFKQMKDYIVENQGLINQRDYLQLSLVVAEHSRDINAIKSSLSTIDNEVADVVDRLGNVVTRFLFRLVVLLLKLQSYIIIELKVCDFESRYISQLKRKCS